MSLYSIYLDTSDHLVVGLLDQQFSFLDFHEEDGRKNSGKIHSIIHRLCETQKLDLNKDIVRIYHSAGPGSYTGMRVSEGLAKILKWQGFQICSFFHFEIPLFIGEKNFRWIAKAFKGEFFICEFVDGVYKTQLLEKKIFFEFIKNKKLYTHYKSELEKDFLLMNAEEDFQNLEESALLIRKQPNLIFEILLKRNLQYSPFYFRTLEQEFKVSS